MNHIFQKSYILLKESPLYYKTLLVHYQSDSLKGLLLNKKNIILQGAPGVGKTFAAKRLAYSIMGVKDESYFSEVIYTSERKSSLL